MTAAVTPADLRAMIECVGRHPGASAEAWRERWKAQYVLGEWNLWLVGLLDLIEVGSRTTATKPAPMREDVTQADVLLSEKLGRKLSRIHPTNAGPNVVVRIELTMSEIERLQHRLAHTARPDAGDEVERWCRVLAKADGLDWDAICPYESKSAEEIGDIACESGTCVAAHYEDHEPDVARSRYRRLASAVSALAAMREGVDRGMVEVPREMIAFLKGVGPLDGVCFGDTKPEGERGNFWWRKHLPTVPAALDTEQPR